MYKRQAYTIQVTARGYHPVNVSGINVFADETAIQEVELEPTGEIEEEQENIVIPANTLFGDYPPKIAEAEVKPVAETGEIVLNRVVIPEYVICLLYTSIRRLWSGSHGLDRIWMHPGFPRFQRLCVLESHVLSGDMQWFYSNRKMQ